jgi:hypothetical protein
MYWEGIFLDECSYERTVCYEGTSIFINIMLDAVAFLDVTWWCNILEEQKPQLFCSRNLKCNIIFLL